MKPRYRVVVIESEKGWGQKVDEVRDFKTLEEAEAFRKIIHSANTADAAPDIYWRAEEPRLVDLDAKGAK